MGKKRKQARVFGLRQVISTYTGPVVRVRRSSDGAEHDQDGHVLRVVGHA